MEYNNEPKQNNQSSPEPQYFEPSGQGSGQEPSFQQTPSAPKAKPESQKKIIAIVLAILITVGGYFLFGSNDSKNNEEDQGDPLEGLTISVERRFIRRRYCRV